MCFDSVCVLTSYYVSPLLQCNMHNGKSDKLAKGGENVLSKNDRESHSGDILWDLNNMKSQ